MGQDIRRIRKVYDTVAQEYAEAFCRELSHKPLDRQILADFAQALRGQGRVWELGCGPGHIAAHLADQGLDMAGLDLSPEIVRQAQKRYPHIPFAAGDMLALALADDSLAGIVAFYAMVHFDKAQARRALHEAHRVLRPGGRLLFSFHVGSETLHIEEFLGRRINIDFMLMETEFAIKTLEACGFENLQVREREPYPEVEYPSRRAYVQAIKPEQEEDSGE